MTLDFSFLNTVITKLENSKSTTLVLKISPNSPKNQISEEAMADGSWKVKITATPERGEANKELVNFLEKLFDYKLKIRILSGQSSRIKLVKFSKNQ